MVHLYVYILHITTCHWPKVVSGKPRFCYLFGAFGPKSDRAHKSGQWKILIFKFSGAFGGEKWPLTQRGQRKIQIS